MPFTRLPKINQSLSSGFRAVALGFCALVFRLHNLNAQSTFDEKLTTQGNLKMTITNVGMVGNNFKGSFTAKGYPSCEFPAKSNNENMGQGGLWIGGIVNGQRRVSTAASSSANGYGVNNPNYEFAAQVGATIQERSSLRSRGSLYRDDAVSHQDFIANFSEKYLKVPGSVGPGWTDHKQMGLDVTLESYNWNYSYSNFFVILNYKIKNTGSNVIDSAFVGFWGETVLRNVINVTPGTTGFFSKGGNGYIDSLNTGYEFDATNPADGPVKSYIGIKYLGATDKTGFLYNKAKQKGGNAKSPNFRIGFNSWIYNSNNISFSQPNTDDARFDKMQNSMKRRSSWLSDSTLMKNPASRSIIISAGPFARLNPPDTIRKISGDSILITFAIVCARSTPDGNPSNKDTESQKYDFIKNLQWTQTVFDGNDRNHDGKADNDSTGEIIRYILPSPPDIPQTKVIAKENAIDVYWTKNSENTIDPISKKKDFQGFRLYKTSFNFEHEAVNDVESNLKPFKQWDRDNDTLSFNTGLKEIALSKGVNFENDTNTYWYKYTFQGLQNGWQHVIALTAFDNGDTVNNLPSLESAPLQNLFRVFPGTRANHDMDSLAPFVYPNPYYGDAAWEGPSASTSTRKIYFAGLPKRARIKVFSSAGDLVHEIQHDETYTGADNKWFVRNSNVSENILAGGEHAWDLLSNYKQLISRGLYLFTVEDLETGKIHQGKFTLIK